MARITVKRNGNDVNGNTKYLYNFIFVDGDGERNFNDQFKILGRVTKNGVHSTTSPSELEELMNDHFGFIHKLPCNTDLGKAQKVIDKCNKMEGCSKTCNQSRIDTCWKVQNHRKLISLSCDVNEFKFVEIEEVE